MQLRSPRARHWLDQLLHTHDTPERTAAAFALGVFLGFSPFLGLHTVLGLVGAFAFRLNRVAVLLGVYSNLPWILPAYYTLSTLLGAFILRVDVPPGLMRNLSQSLAHASVADPSWWHFGNLAHALTGHFRSLAHALKPLMWAFMLGSTLGAVALAVSGYRAALAMILAHRRMLAQRDETLDK